jgi:hypothetical protein
MNANMPKIPLLRSGIIFARLRIRLRKGKMIRFRLEALLLFIGLSSEKFKHFDSAPAKAREMTRLLEALAPGSAPTTLENFFSIRSVENSKNGV